MNNQLASVTRINQNKEETVWDNIQIWLEKYKKKSPNTALTYEKSVRDFFIWLRDKRLEDLNPADLTNKVKGNVFIQYQNFLKDKGVKNSTVNTKFGAIRSLYSFLAEDYPIKKEWFSKVDRFSEDEDSESYGTLYHDEIIAMIEILKKDGYKGEEKALLWEVAEVTSFRKQSLLNLKWSDICFNKEQNLYIVSTYLKRKKDKKPITPDLYERLLKIKKPNEDRIFTLATSTIQLTMDRLKKKLNIDESRNVSFHSLKKTAINFAAKELKDFDMAKTQGNHCAEICQKNYIEANKDYAKMPGILIYEKPNLDMIDELPHDVLVKIIKQKCSSGCQREIVSLAENYLQEIDS